MLRRLAVVAVAGLGLGFAHSGPAGAAVYTVCGYGVTVPHLGGGSCMTMATAIADAQATPEADTIQMLPGTYCPIDLEGTFAQPIKFVGVGFAGVDSSGGPVSFSGPEASLTTISDDSLHCDPSAYDIQVNTHVTSSAPMVFQNITADGTSGGEYGFHQAGVDTYTILRDDIFENFSGQFGWGVYFQSGGVGCCSSTTLDLDNSAVLDNTYGVDLEGADASVYDTTIAGNTNTGLTLVNYEVSLGSDTISHNRVGVNAPSGGSDMQIVDSVVAGNTSADCGQVSDWESGGGFEPGSFGNLVGSFSCPINQGTAHGDARDTTLTSATMPPVDLNGGPTPSILPPLSAQGFDTPNCGLFGVDQREFLNPAAATCDAGAVQSGGNGAMSASTGNLTVGEVALNGTAGGTVSLTVTGGDLVGVSGVSISGAGWSVVSDGCTFTLMAIAFNGGCNVGVSVHPTSIGAWNGTLTIHTTAGDRTAHLFAHVPHAPLFSSFAPMRGPAGTVVTISGFNFTGATGVAFNGTPAASFTVNSDSSISATVAGGTTTGFVTITGPGGTGTSLHVFTVVTPAPNLTGFTPLHGVIGATVTLTGTHFTGATGVSFNGTPAVAFSVVSDTLMTAVVPAGAATGHVSVTGPGGISSSPGVFTVLPKIASFTPASGSHGTHVTIRGSGFTGATSVVFHGKSAVFTVVNDTTISATVPVGATTGHIFVTTPAGTAMSATTFSIP
jgi:IPT/TIG domain